MRSRASFDGRRVRVPESWRDTSGQTLIEAALVVPLLALLAMGVVELGFAMRNQHTVNVLCREGSNLISRSTTLTDATTVLTSEETGTVDFSTNSQIIFSVIERGATVGSANYNTPILYERYSTGALSNTSKLTTKGTGTFGGAPDYVAVNPDTDTSLQVTNVPAGVAAEIGGLSYITEIFSTNTLMTALANWGVTVPTTIYSISYF
jgi:Flp pilus assembly protein TadG